MTWVRIDDGFVRHPKVMLLPHKSIVMHIAGLCYCASNLTDGRVPNAAIPLLIAEARVTKAAVKPLLDHGLWRKRPDGDGYMIHDYLKYQESRQTIEARRERWRNQKQSQRGSDPDSYVESTADTTADTTAESARPIPSHPIPSTYSSLDTHHHSPADTDRRKSVINRIVTHRLERWPSKTNPANHRKSIAASAEQEYGTDLDRYLQQFPDAPIDVIAGALETGDARALAYYTPTPEPPPEPERRLTADERKAVLANARAESTPQEDP